jgi:16S rRNA processing protein RimM
MRYELVNVNPAGRGALKLTVAGIDRVEAAEALKGAAVSVDRECLPELGANEFYYFDMIGCEVVTTAGAPLGRIEEVFDNGAHDVIVVRDESEERMLPVIDSIVLELDLERRRVVVKPIPEMTD